MSDWDRLNNDFQASPVGLDMKVSMNLRFEGTFEAFVAWAHEIFKAPEKMPLVVTVTVGNAAPSVPAWQPKDSAYEALRKLSASGDPEKVDAALVEARRLANHGSKIEAIKVMRAATGWGLAEAKNFVETHFFTHDNIPF